MNDDEFKEWVRIIGLWFAGIMGAVIGLYLLIVAGWATHAYINQIDPDPPMCRHEQTCQDKYGQLVRCVRRYEADDAGNAINLPDPPASVADAGK